jgi:hypothetical protein
VVGSRRPKMVAHEECRHPIAAPPKPRRSFPILSGAESYHREYPAFTDGNQCVVVFALSLAQKSRYPTGFGGHSISRVETTP